MEGPPLSEFSSLVAPDLFDRYPDFESHARSEDGNLIVKVPMPSGHGTIVISVLQMPTVRVEIHGCPESLREFDDSDETFGYVDRLRIGTREPMDQFQDYDAGGVAPVGEPAASAVSRGLRPISAEQLGCRCPGQVRHGPARPRHVRPVPAGDQPSG